MNIFNKHLFNVVRRLAFPLAVQHGIKRLFFIRPCRVVTCRTFVLSPLLNKDSSSASTDKLDLDGWKHVVRSVSQEETSEKTSENVADSSLSATRDLIEMWRLLGKAVPEHISEEQFQILMEYPTKTSKRKYLKFLAIKERVKKAQKEKKQEKQKQVREEKELKANENNNGEIKNTFLMKFWTKSEDTLFHWRAAQAMIFGQPLVFDMGYENYMSRKEMENAVKQMMESEGINRRTMDPFHLHYCNFKVDGPYHKLFIKRYGEAWDKLFVTMTEKSHVEIFPRDQLVYLTADSPNVMKTFEHDKIYIIGSLVDKSIQKGVSLGQAKRMNLATARLPLDQYLQWEEGAKNLTLDQMMQILMTLKDTGDWMKALQFVPKRKHSGLVEPAFYSKHPFGSEKKMKVSDKTAGQEKASNQSARNSFTQQIQRKWWEDVS